MPNEPSHRRPTVAACDALAKTGTLLYRLLQLIAREIARDPEGCPSRRPGSAPKPEVTGTDPRP
jgi:hypothetical protein